MQGEDSTVAWWLGTTGRADEKETIINWSRSTHTMIHNAVLELLNEAWKGASRQLAKQSSAESLRQTEVDTAVW